MKKKERFVVFLLVVMAFMIFLNYLNSLAHEAGKDHFYGMMVRKHTGEMIYFPDACATKIADGENIGYVWILDKNQVVYAGVKLGDVEDWIRCNGVPVKRKDFNFKIVNEVDCVTRTKN